jgi:hypothetical protein
VLFHPKTFGTPRAVNSLRIIMSKTAVGLFEKPSVADQVVHELGASGFPRSEIRLLREPLDMPVSEVTSIPHVDFEVRLGRDLEAIGASAGEANAYVQGVRRGGVLVFATGSNEGVDSAAEIMNRHGAINVEELIGREPGNGGNIGENVSLPREDMPPVHEMATQTGRIRQSGDGVRMFVW